MTEAGNISPGESVGSGAERMSLGAQLRVAGAVLAVMGASLLTKDISPEQQDPEWVRLRAAELEAQAAYDSLPSDASGRKGAHDALTEAFQERNDYEAEKFDPQP